MSRGGEDTSVWGSVGAASVVPRPAKPARQTCRSRDLAALSLETAVKKLSFDTASTWGIAGRGLLQPGWFADLNVIDLPALDLGPLEVR